MRSSHWQTTGSSQEDWQRLLATFVQAVLVITEPCTRPLRRPWGALLAAVAALLFLTARILRQPPAPSAS